MRSSTTNRPTPTRRWSIGCWRRRTTANAGRGTGSTWPAMPTPTATRRTAARTIWPYRDWVIDAFNDDMPFDRFTIEQLAGDLLPEATLEQKVATGFHRNTMLNDGGRHRQGGVPRSRRQGPRGRHRDRVAGHHFGLRQCHNHKYDPFTQAEYYRFYSFFNQTEDTGAGNGPESPSRRRPSRKRWTG